MEAKIAADAPLDYVTFQIFPENRYDAWVCSNEEEEIIGHGPLDQLLEYLPNIRDQVAKESSDSFKMKLPDNVNQNEWFTKATLTRFLHVICSPDSLNKSVAISKEMSQLEETRKFHLSLYGKAEDGIISSDNSKNELLQAMDSRFAALMEELVSTFNMAAGTIFSCQEMIDLQKFCQHFGDEDIRNLLSKLSETSQKGQTVVPMENKKSHVPLMSKNDVNKTGRNVQMSGSMNSVKPVIYNASSAKAAEVERQSLTESDDSSFSSDDDDDDQPPIERSRTLIRSASPRRSASPMRRIQIGRSGPRRTPALTIKNLTCFPARERISSHGDMGNESEEPNKKTEVNVTRISVQDAISLFESKQKDQATDTQKKSFVDGSTSANKSVLRRWSSGMGESQKSLAHNISENAASDNNSDVVDEDIKPVTNPGSENAESKETVEVNMVSETSEKNVLHPHEDDVPVSQPEKTNEKLDSVEWSRQKEAELSQMLMKFAEYRIAEPDNGKKKNSSLKQRGGFTGPYKEKRDEKPQGENAGKRAQSEFRAKQKVLEAPKAEKSSMKVSDVGKKRVTSRSSTLNKNSLPVSSIPKMESPKPAMPKKAPSKSSPLPTTRKSWPSTPPPPPPPRATGALPDKIPIGTRSPGTTASRQKPQSPALHQKPKSPAPLMRPSPKLERPQMRSKDVKEAQVEPKKSLKRVDDSKNRVLPRSGNRTKTKTKTGMASEEDAVATPAKAVVRKVTKKSSVVPLEAKPSTRKVSGTIPAKKGEIPTQVEETLTKFEDPINIQEGASEPISDTVDLGEGNQVSETHNSHLETEKEMEIEEPKEKTKDGSEEETSNETPIQGNETPAEIQPVQEPLISPAAWVESSHQDPPMAAGNSAAPSPLNHDVGAASGTRVRHSLSQMLLEESSEPDITEWGNAENPPTMVYQKDAPKGLKRLLKFARKNKGEANGTAWASPYTSEGEDDGDETKSLGKRHSDNLLRKVALHSKNYGEGFFSDSEPLSARSNASNSSARSSNKFQEGHTTSKGARSFFSLSAFRGNKN